MSFKLATALSAGLLVASGAWGQTVVETGKIDAQARVYEILDKDTVKITFDRDSPAISAKGMGDIETFVATTSKESPVDRFIIAAWSDKDYPAKDKLPKADRDLAAERAQRVEYALRAAGAKEIDKFEMTERPNWIQRMFSTETAEIKGSGRSTTEHERLIDQIGERLRTRGGPGSVVVVAKFKNQVVSH